MSVPQLILDLIHKFDDHLQEYTSTAFNEETAKNQFIEPLFEALGWDVGNQAGKPEAWRDVLRQFSIPSGPTRKAPDYIFKIGKTKVFIVEAKKPAVNIKQDANAALQVRSYGWNLKLPLGILANFMQFAVYDCRLRPKKNDSAEVGRLRYYVYKNYPEHWDEIAEIFSRAGVESGRLDKFVESKKARKGALEVDEAFLQEIEDWRKILAVNIALRNPQLDQREINFAVQATIDRIVFLRIAEDRGIESPAQLLGLTNAPRLYPRLFKLFENADDRYNSGLFHFREEKERTTEPDRITPDLKIDDDKLKTIIRSLYENFYDFSLMPVEILGQIYEKFLGNVIVLTEGHHAKVKEKPQVKKAGGVFYTPFYVVEFMVAETLAKLLEGKTPAAAAKLKILDPACGSGSFLLGAYEKLLDWHLDYYVSHGPEKHRKQIYPVLGGGFRLATQEKKRILLNNIYGVDIDPQAVEVTKLSLLLKVLENETEESLRQLKLIYKERALPDLGHNVKCGNSLIGTDFYHNHQLNFLDDEERLRINAFDWETGFADIYQGETPGFDAVIGNPPYGAPFTPRETLYFQNHCSTFKEIKDRFVLFIERCLGRLKRGGRLSFITPSAWLGGPSYHGLRALLLNYQIEKMVQLPFDVFADAYIDTVIFVLHQEKASSNHQTLTYTYGQREKIEKIHLAKPDYQSVKQALWKRSDDKKIVLSPQTLTIMETIQKNTSAKLEDAAKMKRGVLFDKRLLTNKKSSASSFRYFEGDVYRYQINLQCKQWIEFDDRIKERPKEIDWFRGERILLRRLVNRRRRLMATVTGDPFISNKNLYSVLPIEEGAGLRMILGILNSKLISYLYTRQISQAVKDDFPQVTIQDLYALPFPQKNKLKFFQARITKLVAEMLELNADLKQKKLDYERAAIKRQIAATDRMIDQLVYELYGLNEDEIKIVEGEVPEA